MVLRGWLFPSLEEEGFEPPVPLGSLSPGQLRAELLVLRLADVGDDEGIGYDAFRVAREAVAIGQVFDAVVANTERGLLKVDARSALHQRSLELVAADHLVQHLSWGMSCSGGAKPAPRQPVPPPSTGSSPPMRPSSAG
jgi:hypothetical protein